jgi:KDO2-lipid IV(A) lauroyltransferase
MKISHGFEYAAFWCLTGFTRLLPGRLREWIAAWLGRLGYIVAASRRRIAKENLKRAFGDEKSEAELKTITKGVFVNIVRSMLEFACFPRMTKEKIRRLVPEHTGLEYLDEALKGGKGCMFVAGHLGHWELIGAWVAAYDYPVDYLVGQQHNPYVDNAFNDYRRPLGVRIIPVGLTARHVIESLRENRMVALLSDQHSATGGAVVTFFGRPASTPKGPAAFAVKTGCPIVFGSLVREGYNRHRGVIEPPIYPPNSGDKEKDIIDMTQAYTSMLEAVVRQHPEQWMWTHRRWKLD